MSIHLKQFERAERYLERLHRIYAGTYVDVSSADYYDDEVASFFIHCHHIRDWVIQLSKIPVSIREVDEFINTHEELRICADMCNGEKHCRLERAPRTGSQPHLAGREYRVTCFTPESGIPISRQATYKILSGGKWMDALEVASRCVELWRTYLEKLQEKYVAINEII